MNYNHHKIPSNCNRRDALIERKQHISRFNGSFFFLSIHFSFVSFLSYSSDYYRASYSGKNLSNNFDTLLSETHGTHDRNKHFREKFFRHWNYKRFRTQFIYYFFLQMSFYHVKPFHWKIINCLRFCFHFFYTKSSPIIHLITLIFTFKCHWDGRNRKFV